MKRRYRGLYDGKHIQFGNKVSFSHRKTRRTWKPNVQHKRFWSETYQRYLQFRCTTSLIKKVKALPGGIDEYLRTASNQEILYPKAIKIKANQRRHARYVQRQEKIASMTPEERVAAGLPATGISWGWGFLQEGETADAKKLLGVQKASELASEAA